MLDSYNSESYRRKIEQIQNSQGGRRIPERESGLSHGHIMAGVGVAAAGTIALRRGGIAKVGRYVDRQGRAAYRSAKEVFNRASPMFKADNVSFKTRLRTMRDDYKASYEANLKFIDENPSRRRARDVEIWMKNIEKMLGSDTRLETKGKEGQLLDKIKDQFVFNNFIKGVTESQSDFMKGNRNEVIQAMSRIKPYEFGRLSGDEIKEILAGNKIATKNDDIDEIYGLLNNAKMQLNKTDDVYNIYKTQQEKLYKEFIQNIINKESVDLKGGLRKKGGKLLNNDYVTVDDILTDHEKLKKIVDDETIGLLRRAKEENEDFGKVVFDRNLKKRKDAKGQTVYEDYAVFDEITSDAVSWYSKSFFGGILQLRNTKNLRDAKRNNSFVMFDRGSAQPFISSSLGNDPTDALAQTFITGMGKVYRATDFDEIVNEASPLVINTKRDIVVMPLRDGSFGRMYESMAGARAEGEDRNAIMEILDIGNQDMDSTAKQIMSVFTKFKDSNWNRNFIKKVNTTGLEDSDDLYKLQTYLSIHSLGITSRGVNALRSQMSDEMQDLVFAEGLEFSQQAHRLKMFEELGEKLIKRVDEQETAAGLSVIESKVLTTYKQYIEDPYGFSLRTTNIGISNPLLNHHSRQRTGFDEIDQHLSMAIFDDIFKKGKTNKGDIIESSENVRALLNEAYDGKMLDARDLQHAEESLNYAAFLGSRFNRRDIDEASIEAVNDYISSSEGFRLSLERMGKRTDTLYSRYVPEGEQGVIQSNFIAVGAMDTFSVKSWNSFADQMDNGNTREALKDLFSPITQFFAGRKNMDDVTTATLLPYYTNYRLQDALGTVGLSFSDKSLGSTHGIMLNLLSKRILPPVLAYEAFEFADYAMDSITGAGFTERYETMKANQDIARAQRMTDQDRYDVMKSRQLRPGAEHLAAMPEFSLPILGTVGPGRALSALANIALLDTNFSLDERAEMTEEEVRDDLYFGVEEVRKSRWWFAGSTSAYRGDRITMYRPNSFRMAHSDWEDAGVGLTRKERWQNSMLPNPLNPLGGLSHLIGLRDPYYFENKHYEDRPYLLTGQYFNPNTMFFGDIGNMLIGNIIKPVREMHEEYWGEPMIVRREDAFMPDDLPSPDMHAYKITGSGSLNLIDLGIGAYDGNYEGVGDIGDGIGLGMGAQQRSILPPPPEIQQRENFQREYDSIEGRINQKYDESLGYIDLSDGEVEKLQKRYQSLKSAANKAEYAYPEKDTLLDKMLLFTPKIGRGGGLTGDFLLSELGSDSTAYVSNRIAKALNDLSFGEFVKIAKRSEAESKVGLRDGDIVDTYISSASGGSSRIIAGINDFGGINSVMGGMHSSAPTEMIMGNSYREVIDHSNIQREVRMRANMHPNEYGPVTYDPNPYRRFALEEALRNEGSEISEASPEWIDMSGTERLQGELPVMELNDPRSLKWRTQEALENWSEPLGVYKWLVKDELFRQDSYKGKAVIQTADAATNISNSFWESNLGSLGGPISEIGRRFIRKDSGFLEFYNPIRNQMPDWMPGDNYFINFKEGDPYVKVEGGEYRLPGAAYESLNELHSDHFGSYGAFDRFKILADVAPWSEEYRMWRDYVDEYIEDETLKEDIKTIKEQARKRLEKFDFQPYRFKGNDIRYETGRVENILDDGKFTIEGSDDIYKLAGIDSRASAYDAITSFIEKGDKVKIGVTKDEAHYYNRDTYKTVSAVVLKDLENINRTIIDRGMMKEDMDDFSAAGIHARFSKTDIMRGKVWEHMAHASTPINTKFMKVRSAVEEYERSQFYGKDFATWNNILFDDYIQPWYETLGKNHNPLANAAAGFALSAGLSFFFLPAGKARLAGTLGGTTFAVMAGLKESASRILTGRAEIPERRQKETNINEYFDILNYMKYHALYQKARIEIAERSGIDIEAVVQNIEAAHEQQTNEKRQIQANNRKLKKHMHSKREEDANKDKEKLFSEDPTLQRTIRVDSETGEIKKIKEDDQKRWRRKEAEQFLSPKEKRERDQKRDTNIANQISEALYGEGSQDVVFGRSVIGSVFKNRRDFIEDRFKENNEEIKELSRAKAMMIASPDIVQALEYRKKMSQTIYGLDLSQNNMDIAQAFPHKDRYFFEAFVDATEQERKRLREILPKYQLAVYERIWSGDRGKAPTHRLASIEEYAQYYNIPDVTWEGWRPENSLDAIKVQAVAQEGIDLTDFGFWETDLDQAMSAPTLNRYNGDNSIYNSHNKQPDFGTLQHNLRNILNGAGLWDVNVTVVPARKEMTQISFVYEMDRSLEVSTGLAKEMM